MRMHATLRKCVWLIWLVLYSSLNLSFAQELPSPSQPSEGISTHEHSKDTASQGTAPATEDSAPALEGEETGPSRPVIKRFGARPLTLDEQEEAALLAHAPRHIQALLIAAIDTGMRSGEMLALRFADIDLERGLITLRGETTKSRKTRLVPISTTRLRDVLTWLRQDIEGKPKPLETRVFSNELGEPYRLFH